jgi:hypothetical protein
MSLVGLVAIANSDRTRIVPCTSAECRRLESFLKEYDCGEFPDGNGSGGSCEP